MRLSCAIALILALPGCDYALGYDDVTFLHGDAAAAPVATDPPPAPDPDPSEPDSATQPQEDSAPPSQQDAAPPPEQDAEPPSQETLVRNEILAVANAEVGYCSNDARPYMLAQPGLWCWDFVDWVYEQAGKNLGMSLPSPDDTKKIWSKSPPAGWLPEGGDLIKYWIQHYGLVETSSPDGKHLTTIEGNYNDCVVKVDRARSEVNWFGSLDGLW
ncbi:MAG: CHAP domain-containing protein [Deltaproteobacteria bacterium]|nr:CHAP domain-containing protein [Deltaproteobacteria bacterium]